MTVGLWAYMHILAVTEHTGKKKETRISCRGLARDDECPSHANGVKSYHKFINEWKGEIYSAQNPKSGSFYTIPL